MPYCGIIKAAEVRLSARLFGALGSCFRGWWLLLWAGILIGAVLLTAYITKHHDKLSHKIETLFIKRQNKENYTTQSNNNK